MTHRTRHRMTVASVWSAVVLVAGGIGFGVDWALKKGEQLGVESAKVDSLRTADSLLILEIKDIKRTLHLQARKIKTVSQPQREGWLRRALRKII